MTAGWYGGGPGVPPLPPPPPGPPPPPSRSLASSGQRGSAAVIDAGLIVGASFALILAFSATLGPAPRTPGRLSLGDAIIVAIGIAAVLVGPSAYLCIGWRNGQTIGMRLVNIEVVSVAGGRLSMGQVVLRLAGAYWSAVLVFIGFIAIVFDRDKRGWHDRMAGSRVIEGPAPVAGYYPAWQQAQWPGYAVATVESTHPPEAGSLPAPGPGRAEVPDPDPVRRAWRSTATWGRSPWTWTDVVPVVGLFVPILTATGAALAWLIHRYQPNKPIGLQLGVELTAFDLLTYSACLLMLFLVVRVRRHAGLRDLGLGRVAVRWLLVALPALAIAMIMEASGNVIGQSLFPGTPNNQCTAIRADFAGYLPVAIISVSILAPIVEETFFRGFLLRYLRDRMAWWVALVVSAAIFSAGHLLWGEPTLFLPIFFAGLALGALYLYSGSVWPGVIMHGFFNLIPVLVLFLGNASCT